MLKVCVESIGASLCHPSGKFFTVFLGDFGFHAFFIGIVAQQGDHDPVAEARTIAEAKAYLAQQTQLSDEDRAAGVDINDLIDSAEPNAQALREEPPK